MGTIKCGGTGHLNDRAGRGPWGVRREVASTSFGEPTGRVSLPRTYARQLVVTSHRPDRRLYPHPPTGARTVPERCLACLTNHAAPLRESLADKNSKLHHQQFADSPTTIPGRDLAQFRSDRPVIQPAAKRLRITATSASAVCEYNCP